MDVLKCKLTQKRGKVLITWERLLVNITLSRLLAIHILFWSLWRWPQWWSWWWWWCCLSGPEWHFMTRNLHIGIIQLCLSAGSWRGGNYRSGFFHSFIIADLMYDTHSFSVIKYNHFYSSIKNEPWYINHPDGLDKIWI